MFVGLLVTFLYVYECGPVYDCQVLFQRDRAPFPEPATISRPVNLSPQAQIFETTILNTNVHGDVIGTMIIGMLSWEATPVFVQVGGVTTTWGDPAALFGADIADTGEAYWYTHTPNILRTPAINGEVAGPYAPGDRRHNIMRLLAVSASGNQVLLQVTRADGPDPNEVIQFFWSKEEITPVPEPSTSLLCLLGLGLSLGRWRKIGPRH